MFDTGWAGTFMKMCKEMGEKNLKLADIKCLLVSHFHPDHMGIAGELALQGVTVVVMESQKNYIHASDYVFERDKRFAYTPVLDDKIKVVSFEDSREFLQELGIEGCVIPTPGHSDDSISLLLDSGDVFVGDLYPLYELDVHDETDVQESWKKLLAAKPKRIFYGHAKPTIMENQKNNVREVESDCESVSGGVKTMCNVKDTENQKNAELHDIVKKIMRMLDKDISIEKIASKLRLDREFVGDVCRMYLTHKNVGVQGILDRIEIKGR